MTDIPEYSVCILCSYSFPNSSKNPPNEATVKTLNQFIQQTGVVNRKCSSGSGGLLGRDQVSVCPNCFDLISKAVERREKVDKSEGHLRYLQGLVLMETRRLSGLVEGNLEQMTKLEGKIKGGDQGCLRAFSRGGGPSKEGAWSWDNIFQFRDGIIKVTKEMGQFKTNLVDRNGCGDERGIDLVGPVGLPEVEILEETSVRPSQGNAAPQVEHGRDDEDHDRDGVLATSANLGVAAEVTHEQLKPGRKCVDASSTSIRRSFPGIAKAMIGSSRPSLLTSSNPKASHGLAKCKGRKALAKPTNLHLLDIEKVPGVSKKLKALSRKKKQTFVDYQNRSEEKFPYSCSVCGRRYTTAGLRDRHVKLLHSEDKWKCEVCEKEFVLKRHLTLHISKATHQDNSTEGK